MGLPRDFRGSEYHGPSMGISKNIDTRSAPPILAVQPTHIRHTLPSMMSVPPFDEEHNMSRSLDERSLASNTLSWKRTLSRTPPHTAWRDGW